MNSIKITEAAFRLLFDSQQIGSKLFYLATHPPELYNKPQT